MHHLFSILDKDAVTLNMFLFQVVVVGSVGSLLGNIVFLRFTSFASTIFWLLLGSILIPLVASAAKTAYRHPLLVLGHAAWKQVNNSPPRGTKMVCLRLFNLIGYPLVPSVLIDCRETAKQRIADLQEEGKENYNNSKSNLKIKKSPVA